MMSPVLGQAILSVRDKMKLKFGIGLAAVFIAANAFASFDGVTFKLSPKVGDSHKYRETAKFDVGGADFEFSAISTRKTVKADPSGTYSIKEEMSEMKFNGQEAPEGQGPGDTTVSFSPMGEIVKIEGDRVDENLYRFSNLALFIQPDKPVNAGDTWNYEVKENKTTGVVPAKATYTFVGEEKVGSTDALKVKYLIKETGDGGASSDGTLWLNKSDFTLIKLSAKWVNAPITGAGTISGDISVVLIQ